MQRRTRAYVVGFAIFLVVLCYLFLLPPLGFPVGKEIVIPADRPFSDTAEYLEQERVVRSAFVLKAVARVFQADRDVQAGRYVFSSPAGLSTVLYRLTSGISGLPSAQVTLPEGMSAREMGIVLAAEIPGFDADTFVSLATPHEGTLFPDTYDIYLDATPEDVVSLLRATYDEKLEEVRPAIEASGRSEEEIVIMASLLEKEAKTDEDRKMVSGILWDRIEIGMPLQVDAVFGYIHGRDTYHPSFEDLESDSPYNTYTNQGLPPGAIGNPGLAAIRAALTPIETEYLYYLSGTDGTMHYARTFEEHKENREKYLR
ncbi:MAG TPA: endolytic transglycosylase MltG [Candidatus Paceibacterota bacterium]|nr:endolytic transglycosylase MltG [Candidatus Paceibacterota bacterium]